AAASERIYRRPRAHRRHRRRASRSQPPTVQPRAVDLRRWVGHRHGGCHRTNAHAVFPRDRGRRRRGASGLTRPSRSELKALMADEPLTDAPDAPAASESSELADAQRERDEFKDRWMRKTAEFDN